MTTTKVPLVGWLKFSELKLGEKLGYWNHSTVYANFKNKAEDK